MADTVTRHFRRPPFPGGPVDYLVYPREEADAEGIQYREKWWMAREPLEWVLTEDDWVMQLAYALSMPRKKGSPHLQSYTMRFTAATAMAVVADTGELFDGFLRYAPYREAGYQYSYVHPGEPWHVRYGRRGRAKDAVALYVRFVLASRTGRVSRQQYDEVGRLLEANPKKPGATARVFLRTPTAKTMIAQRMRDVLEEIGVTPTGTIAYIVDSIEVAKKKGDARAMQSGAERLIELLREAGFNSQDVRGIEVEYSKIEELDVGGPPPELPEPISRKADESKRGV